MKVLELFAGSRSIGKVAESFVHKVFSIDVVQFGNIDLMQDIEYLTSNQIPFIPDMIWASPPCTTYSIAAISHHRNNQIAKTEFAEKSDRVIKRVLELIQSYDCIYYIENPVGMLRKMLFMIGLPRATITYCSYGDKRMKPTDIWSNNIYSIFNPDGWIYKERCFNGCKHHERAPRGSKTGTQGLENNYERSKIPESLCLELLEAAQKRLKQFRSQLKLAI